jgi:hypothetical protein
VFRKFVFLSDKEKCATTSTSQIPHPRVFARRPFAGRGQALNDERAQIVFQYDLLKVAMKLRDRRVSTPHRRQLTGVLCQEGIEKGMHIERMVRPKATVRKENVPSYFGIFKTLLSTAFSAFLADSRGFSRF